MLSVYGIFRGNSWISWPKTKQWVHSEWKQNSWAADWKTKTSSKTEDEGSRKIWIAGFVTNNDQLSRSHHYCSVPKYCPPFFVHHIVSSSIWVYGSSSNCIIKQLKGTVAILDCEIEDWWVFSGTPHMPNLKKLWPQFLTFWILSYNELYKILHIKYWNINFFPQVIIFSSLCLWLRMKKN